MNAADGEGGRISVRLEELFDESRFDIIVAVDETDEIASGIFKTSVPRGGLTLVFLMDGDDAGVFFGVLFDYFGRVIGGAVVDKDDFKILIGLGSD